MNLKELSCPRPLNKEFEKYWNELYEDLKKNDTLYNANIKHLVILCDLFVEYDNLTVSIEETGYLEYTETKYGTHSKISPYVMQRERTNKSILLYSKSLGLTLKNIPASPEGEEDDWS